MNFSMSEDRFTIKVVIPSGSRMSGDRYIALMTAKPPPSLTREEADAGWHFCWDLGGLLIGPEMEGKNPCRCINPTHGSVRRSLPAFC